MSVPSQPSVLKSLVSCEASLRPCDQLADKILRLSGNVVPLLTIVVEDTAGDHLQDLLIIVTVEGWVPAEQNVEHAAGGPHIAADVVVSGEHLGRNVIWRACTRLHAMQPAAIHNLGQAKVDNLQVSIGVRAHEQEVLRL